MKASFDRIISIVRKEALHIIHDPRSLMILFLIPLLQLTMFGYALNLEIQNIDLAVWDASRGETALRLIQKFQGSPTFTVKNFEQAPVRIDSLFLRGSARAALLIPPDFEADYRKNQSTRVQIIIDASDPNAATNIRNYCAGVIAKFNEEYGLNVAPAFRIQSAIWYNPDMKSTFFFVPGLMALILVMISALLTSITIVREKEMGTMDQLLVSPVRPFDILLGKVLPYMVLAFAEGLVIFLVALVLFDVPFKGNLEAFLALTLLYVITALSLGLMISTIARSQQVAMMIALTATLLPTIMLSGFIFPISSMPRPLQYISYIIPAKYYLVIVRGIMLKGNKMAQLQTQILFLVGMSSLLLTVAWRKFKRTLEE